VNPNRFRPLGYRDRVPREAVRVLVRRHSGDNEPFGARVGVIKAREVLAAAMMFHFSLRP